MDYVPSSRSRRLPSSRSKEEEAMSFLCKRVRQNKFFTEASVKDSGSRGEDPPGRRSSFCTKGSTKDGVGNHGNCSGGSEDGSEGDPGVSTGQTIGGDGRGTEDDNDSMSGSDGSFSCSFSEDGKGILKAYEHKDRFDASASTKYPKDGSDSESCGGSSKDGNREDLKTSLRQIVDGENFEVCKDKDGFDTSIVTNDLADYLPTSLNDARAKNAATTNSNNIFSSADGDTDSNSNSNSNKGRRKPQIARWLPWRDQRGVLGTYTGQINRCMRPHGCGTLIYEDGSAVTSIWEGGVPIKSWVPWEVKNSKKEPHKPRSRSGSSSSSSNSNSSNDADIANGIAKKQQRQSSGRRRSSSSSNIGSEDVEGSNRNWTYLPHLDLGDAGAPRDMIQLKSGRVALEILDSQLRTLDFAFVLRSDGQWTYAIVAEKREDVVTLVVDGDGGTKTISRRHWLGLIRLVNPREARRSRGGSDGSSKGSNGSKREEEAVDGKGSPRRGPLQRSVSI